MAEQPTGTESQAPAAHGAGGDASTRVSILTPSYARDFDLCADLNRSILAFSPDDVAHHVIVPRRDLGLLARLQGSRAQIHCAADFLPRLFLTVPLGVRVALITPGLVRPALAGVLAAGIALLTARITGPHPFVQLCVAGSAGLLAYVVAAVKQEQLREWATTLRRKEAHGVE